MNLIETLQTLSKEDARKLVSERLSVKALEQLNELSAKTLRSVADKRYKQADAEIYNDDTRTELIKKGNVAMNRPDKKVTQTKECK